MVDYLYIFGGCCLLPRNGILPGAKFSLRPPSLALSYWQRYCTALEQWARAKLCGVEHRAPPIFGRATITLGIGQHSSNVDFVSLLNLPRVSQLWFLLMDQCMMDLWVVEHVQPAVLVPISGEEDEFHDCKAVGQKVTSVTCEWVLHWD